MNAKINTQSRGVTSSNPGSLKGNPAIYRMLAVMVAAALACNFPSAIARPTPETSAQTVPAPAVAGEASVAPASIQDLYFEGVEAGRWSEGQGLLTILRYVAGQVDSSEISDGRGIAPGEATGLIAIAEEYLKANPSAPEKAEMQRLLGALAPDPERLLPYSQPESASGMQSLAPVSVQPDLLQRYACLDLWADGFPPLTGAGGPPVCVVYQTLEAGGATFRIFHAVGWETYGNQGEYLGWAANALRRAAATYQESLHGRLPPTDLIFLLLPFRQEGREDPTVEMYARGLEGDRCMIGVFQKALSLDEPDFEQTVAHELFHCYQGLNLPEASQAPYARKKWWAEGSAEYFGNVAYPTVNREHRWASKLDADIRGHTIFEMDYENFLFFQFLGRKLGDPGLVTLLGTLTQSESDDAYMGTLNSHLGDSEATVHDFAKQYLDIAIEDTGGGPVPVNPRFRPPVDMRSNSFVDLSAPPYQPEWKKLAFPEKQIYSIQMNTEGEGRSSARLSQGPGTWGALPATIDTRCGGLEYVVAATSTQPGGLYRLDVSSDAQAAPECNKCLMGTWELMTESFEPYVRSILAHAVTRFDSATIEKMTLAFDEETGIATFGFVDGVVTQTKVGVGSLNSQGGMSPDTQIVIRVDGSTTSTFEDTAGATPGRGSISYGPAEGTVSLQTTINGMGAPASTINARELIWGTTEAATYECSAATLIYTPNLGDIVPEPLRFKRVSPPPPAP